MQPDPQRSRAILIGVGRYRSPDLVDLPEVEASVAALGHALVAPPTGVFAAEWCTVLLNPTYVQVRRALHQAADATDTLLVHIAGHTIRDGRGRRALACTDSVPGLPWNTIGFDELTEVMARSRAARQALIVDSGPTAADDWAPSHGFSHLVLAGDKPGVGTRELARLIMIGIPDALPWITIERLRRQVQLAAPAVGSSFHMSMSANDEPVALARNAGFRAAPLQREGIAGTGVRVSLHYGHYGPDGQSWPGLRQHEVPFGSEPPEYADLLARHVNVDVLDAAYRLPVSGALRVEAPYLLEVDIGPLRQTGIRAIGAEAFPVHHLPPSDVGWWLELSLSSRDVRCPPGTTPVFLGVVGSAYRCSCRPYTRHQCGEAARGPRVGLPFETGGAGEAELRLVVYHGAAAVQVLRIVLVVGTEDQHSAEDPRRVYWHHRAEVVFSLTRDLRGLGRFADRAVGIVAAEPVAGRHQLVLNDGEHAPEPFELGEEQAGTAARLLRTGLFAAHLEQRGGGWRSWYDTAFAKPAVDLVADLHRLAVAGREAHVAAFPDADRRESLRERLARSAVGGTPATIQVARTANSRVAVPWQLLYEFPVPDRQADAKICPGLADLGADPYRIRCRYEDDPGHHGPRGVVCPFGFWGIAYLLEVPPWSRGVDLAERTGADAPATVVAAVNRAAVGAAWSGHRAALDSICRPPEALVATSTAAVRDAAAAGVDLLYFLCHGRREAHWSGGPDRISLELGPADRLTPQAVADWAELAPRVRWRTRRPLVVLNGCHTGEVLPPTLTEFVSAFVGSLGAAGVLTTEVAMESTLACHAVELLLAHLWGGDGVGVALWRTRRQLLARGNVMGLAYSAYCDVNLRLPQVERSWHTVPSSAASVRPASAS
jgi:hypothetical protein